VSPTRSVDIIADLTYERQHAWSWELASSWERGCDCGNEVETVQQD
jgi:hypothetical protein